MGSHSSVVRYNYIFTVANFLTESDVRILNIVLAEHLPKLEVNLNPDDHPPLTKEEVVTGLQSIGQNEFAKILSGKGGKRIQYNYCF